MFRGGVGQEGKGGREGSVLPFILCLQKGSITPPHNQSSYGRGKESGFMIPSQVPSESKWGWCGFTKISKSVASAGISDALPMGCWSVQVDSIFYSYFPLIRDVGLAYPRFGTLSYQIDFSHELENFHSVPMAMSLHIFRITPDIQCVCQCQTTYP